jgi:hypothetical protein
VIAISWGTSPDSLLVVFSRTFTTTSRTWREIRAASNTLTFTTPWSITYPTDGTDDYDPAMALNPTNRDAMITYTRNSGSPSNYDAMYLYSTDLFHTFKRDSIASSTAYEELTSVAYAPWSPSYYWRVAYRTNAGNGQIIYKALYGTLSSFYSVSPTVVNQFAPSGLVTAAVGFDRDIGGMSYRGNVLYIGLGPQNIYFDAVELALDVPVPSSVAQEYVLCQNFPNPFNPTTRIAYVVPPGAGSGLQVAGSGSGNLSAGFSAYRIRLTVYDLLGREVAVLVDGVQSPGRHEVVFDARHLASGAYLYRLTAGTFSATRKLTIVK